ncbi:MAG: M24 family metallopeptidase [Thermoleophilia bacterium]
MALKTSGPDRPFEGRVRRLQDALAADDLGALVVFDPLNVRYLTGFTGSAGVLLVLRGEAVLVSDFRYRVQAREQAPETRFLELEGRLSSLLPDLLGEVDGVVGIESDHVTVAEWERIRPNLDTVVHRLAGGMVQRLRRVKSEQEIRSIAQAADLAVAVMEHLREMHVIGHTEHEVAFELETWVRREGSGVLPFPIIVGWGANGAKPHAEAGGTVIEGGGLLVVDLGASVDGYASDMTRTFATGPVGEAETRAFETTLRAQEAGRSAVRAGAVCAEVDAVARAVIADAGLGDKFKHGLGHGVGLDVHEEPTLGPRSTDTLESGMVVTVEPGVYLEGVGGVRIEDTVVVEEGAARVLTESDRSLVVLS